MEAIIKEKSQPGSLTLGKVPEMPCGPRDVVIRPSYGAICGTDYHIYSWDAWASSRIQPPLVMGHEFSGIVIETGSEVTSVKEGDRVSAECHITCGLCFLCRTGQKHICKNTTIFGVDIPGAFAEKLVVPEENIWPIAPEIPLEQAALFDPLGNACHTVMAAPMAGQNVLIQGCGPIGLFAVGLAAHSGAQVWASDVNAERLKIASEMGAQRLIDVNQEDMLDVILKETQGLGVDVVLEMSGNPEALTKGLQAVRNGGDVKLLGIPPGEVPINFSEWIIFRGVKIEGIIGRKMYETWYHVQHFLRSGILDPTPVITHRLDYRDFNQGFEDIARGQAGKVILNFEN